MTRSERSLAATIAAHESWAATPDRTARTAAARAAFEQKFLDQADGDPVRADHLRKAYYLRLALKATQARRKIKEFRITPDVTQPSRRTVGGVPIVASPAVAAGVVWCLPRPRIVVGMRKDAELKVDASAFFSSDRVGIRVVMRLGWGFVHNAAITKITVS